MLVDIHCHTMQTKSDGEMISVTFPRNCFVKKL